MSEPLKDQLFHRANVARVASEIAAVHPCFEAEAFVEETVARFPELELKQRIAWISGCLSRYLPGDFRAAVAVLVAALPPPCDPSKGDGDFGDFIYAPYSHFIAERGCRPEHVAFSLETLREITTRFSAKDAIRPFLNRFPNETLEALQR